MIIVDIYIIYMRARLPRIGKALNNVGLISFV
ncbi:hypothetical protein FIV04_22810 (plasmid) [Vibrio sp. THAF190c]|nr:hypothetical protein FIV04_22810 [Vibrio sp. THAF190c]